MLKNLVSLGILITTFFVASYQVSLAQSHCYWRGKAPACAPKCERGEVEVDTNKGNCVTGEKKLCCDQSPPNGEDGVFRRNFIKQHGTCSQRCLPPQVTPTCEAGLVVSDASHSCPNGWKAFSCCLEDGAKVMKGNCRRSACRDGRTLKCKKDEVEVNRGRDIGGAPCNFRTVRVECCKYAIQPANKTERLIFGSPFGSKKQKD